MSNDRLPTIEEMSGLLDWTPAKPEPVLTRAAAEARLTDEALSRAERAFGETYIHAAGSVEACRLKAVQPMRAVLLAALFPEGGQG